MRVLGLCRETKEEEKREEEAGLCGSDSSLHEKSQCNSRKNTPSRPC